MTPDQGGAGMVRKHELRTCPECGQQLRFWDYSLDWRCDVHGRPQTIRFVTVIPDPTPELAKRHPDIDWSDVVEGVRELVRQRDGQRLRNDALWHTLQGTERAAELADADSIRRLADRLSDERADLIKERDAERATLIERFPNIDWSDVVEGVEDVWRAANWDGWNMAWESQVVPERALADRLAEELRVAERGLRTYGHRADSMMQALADHKRRRDDG